MEIFPRRPAKLPRPKRAKLDVPRHQVLQVGVGLQCAVCRKTASRPAAIAAFAEQACDGSGATRLTMDDLGRDAFSSGHRLWITGSVVWCVTCVCHSTRRLRGFAEQCGTRQVQLVARRNLAAGKAPNAKRSDAATHRPQRLTVSAWRQWRDR